MLGQNVLPKLNLRSRCSTLIYNHNFTRVNNNYSDPCLNKVQFGSYKTTGHRTGNPPLSLSVCLSVCLFVPYLECTIQSACLSVPTWNAPLSLSVCLSVCTYLECTIESVLHSQSVFFVLICVTAVSRPQAQDLIHPPCLQLYIELQTTIYWCTLCMATDEGLCG